MNANALSMVLIWLSLIFKDARFGALMKSTCPIDINLFFANVKSSRLGMLILAFFRSDALMLPIVEPDKSSLVRNEHSGRVRRCRALIVEISTLM